MGLLTTLKPMAVPVTRFFGKVGVKIAKHSPELLVTGGIAACTVGAVLACKDTLKAEEVLDEHAKNMETIQQALECNEPGMVRYTEEDAKKDKAKVYARTGLNFIKLYGRSASLFGIGVVMILGGFRIINRRYVATVALAKAQDLAFKNYRGSIREEYGEDADLKALHGIEKEVVTVDEKDEEGNNKKVKKEILKKVGASNDLFAVVFDEMSSKYWENDAFLNRQLICHCISELENKLYMRGYVTYAEVLEYLGMTEFLRDNNPTLLKEATQVGWVHGKGNTNRIDLGLFDVYSSNDAVNTARSMFMNGVEPNVMISPTLDGRIYDLL